MDCLFRAKKIDTYEEYKRFALTVFYSKKQILITLAIPAGLIYCGHLLYDPFLTVLSLFYPFLLYFITCFRIKKNYTTNKILKNIESTYEFYDTYFISTTSVSTTKAEYEKLHKIIETKTNFYPMISKNQGYSLRKADMPEGLDVFLREIKKKYAL